MGYRQRSVEPSVQDFKEWLENDPDTSDVHSVIHEISGSHIPVMTYELLELAMEDLWLATGEPDIEFSEHTAFNAIYGNIYDEVLTECWRVYEEYERRKPELLIFDNRGESMDRYTIFYIGFADNDLRTPFATMSENPDHPQGVNLIDTLLGYPDEFAEYDDDLGWQIEFSELPEKVRRAVIRDIDEMSMAEKQAQ